MEDGRVAKKNWSSQNQFSFIVIGISQVPALKKS